jgi:hypothetical protein
MHACRTSLPSNAEHDPTICPKLLIASARAKDVPGRNGSSVRIPFRQTAPRQVLVAGGR